MLWPFRDDAIFFACLFIKKECLPFCISFYSGQVRLASDVIRRKTRKLHKRHHSSSKYILKLKQKNQQYILRGCRNLYIIVLMYVFLNKTTTRFTCSYMCIRLLIVRNNDDIECQYLFILISNTLTVIVKWNENQFSKTFYCHQTQCFVFFLY